MTGMLVQLLGFHPKAKNEKDAFKNVTRYAFSPECKCYCVCFNAFFNTQSRIELTKYVIHICIYKKQYIYSILLYMVSELVLNWSSCLVS